ncbi:MAG TPA: hypothetical protein VFA18_03375, partial [Gemmataceae bacterium]|nr:hypothetical protein [Gemmataceae bacterium]
MPSSDTAVRPVTTPQQTTTSVPAPTTPTTSRWAWRDWLCLALLAGGVLLTYSEIFSCGFVNYDDGQYVTQNPTVLSGLTVSGFRLAWTTAYAANWHPLTWLSLMLDATMFGREAWGFHLTNVLLHICNTLLLFIIFRWLTGAVWRSAFVAALFGVHPL